MSIFATFSKTISTYSNRNAFFIDGTTYTYADFAQSVSQIRKAVAGIDEKYIGLVANDDMETYAAIIALWFEGKAFVPLGTKTPADRNEKIIKQAFLKTIIDSSATAFMPAYNTILSKQLPVTSINLEPKIVSEEELVYILFTSGTTGEPKGVPITRGNLEGFIAAFDKLGYDINETDKCLQMSELTFDLSVVSYVVPLLRGACLYTVPADSIKFSYAYELMEEQELTVLVMVPSVLQYLRKYFNEINLPSVRLSFFCGEALHLDISDEWCKCLPNVTIVNVYGPTEATVFCTHYVHNRHGHNKANNGILSIGRAMEGTTTIIVDENKNFVPAGSVGELCLGSIQLTPGYWHNEERNKESFFIKEYNGQNMRFYKTGDLCRCDEDGDMDYLGRIDFQVKIQGFRVELSEIEFHAKTFIPKTNVAAIPFNDTIGNTDLGLAIEAAEFNSTALLDYMKTKMPAYMIPKQLLFVPVFPLNTNGKTDRNALKKLLQTKLS